MDNINQYLSSAYEECLHDDVSTCRFFFTQEDTFENTTQQCIEFFGNQSNFVEIMFSNQGGVFKDWNNYIKYSLQNMVYNNKALGVSIKGFADIVEYVIKSNNSLLKNIERNEFPFNSLRNSIIHFVNSEDLSREERIALKSYINGESIKISTLRNCGINDVKVILNKRNCLDFFRTCEEILIKLGVENIIFLNFSSEFSKKGEMFISGKILKDFIDMTALNYFQKSLVIFVINGGFDKFTNENEALRTRLDSCIRVLGKPFPTISPMVEIGKGRYNYE